MRPIIVLWIVMSKLNLDDYSPSSTVIVFDKPLPLLRGPISSSDDDDDHVSSPFILAFRSTSSFLTAYKSCESKLTHQCNEGARIGCSIAATEKCKPKWWENMFGLKSALDYNARQKCEELEMEGCVTAAQEKCRVFAKDKCLGPFSNARVAVMNEGFFLDELGWACCLAGRNEMMDLIEVRKLQARCSTKCLTQLQFIRGSELLLDSNPEHNAD